MKAAETLLAAWERTVRRAPAATAVVEMESGQRFTRTELDVRATMWCDRHGENLLGETVVFAQPNGIGWLEIFIGLLKAGAVVVALDPGEPLAAQRTAAVAIGASRLWIGTGWEKIEGSRKGSGDGRRLVKLTSGSTGKPKALVFTDAQMLADGRQICATMKIARDDVNFALIPLGHSYGLGNLVVPLLLQGTAVVVGSSPMPHVVAAEIERSRATVFPAVPALLRALAESEVPAEKLSQMKTIISAGAPLSLEIARLFSDRFGRKIHGFYGSSETGGISYDRSGEATLRGGVGTALRGVQVRVARGKLSVTSAAVCTVGRRLKTGVLGTHRPSDVAQINARGEITLLGRAGQIVKIAGRRVSLGEIEQAVRAVAGVREAWVGLSSGSSAVLVAAVAGDISADRLRLALREKLASWKIPRRWCVLPELPRTPRGKVNPRALLERIEASRTI